MEIIIIGTGNWGSTLAGLVNPEVPVRLWCEREEYVGPVRRLLPDVAGTARRRITVETAFSRPSSQDDVVLVAVPSSQVAAVARRMAESCPPDVTVVTASKGLERATFRTMSQVIAAILPQARVAVLSGPNIAREIAAGRPAKAMLGCEDVHTLLRVAGALRSDRFHLDMTRETVDLELCGAMKGVFAIGAGVIHARGMGSNFMGLLLTFGLHEITCIARFLGISRAHVFGIAGLGDLVTTCFSPDSRNFRLGELLATGATLEQALSEVQMVVEGAMTASAVTEMAALRLPLPLFGAIAGIVERPGEDSVRHLERTLLEYPSIALA